MSVHYIPAWFADQDKAACGVRLSQTPGRKAAVKPSDLSCAVCLLRTLRTLQVQLGDAEGLDALRADQWPATPSAAVMS